MSQEIIQVDSFTDVKFAGNPAGVCIGKAAMPEDWMQNVAMEMNLAETAFLYPVDDGYHLRWFTPLVEVEMCGHATLASAYILFEDGHVDKNETISFHTLSGILKAKYDNGWIELDFPVLSEQPVDSWPELMDALGCQAKYIGRSRFDCLVETDSEEAVRNLQPDFMALSKLDARGFVVTANGGGEYDFVSRFFAPAVGILEDPVTGSAHCLLGPYWMNKLGKNSFTAYQASKRGGVVRLQVKGDRVLLKGKVVVTIRGHLV